MTSPAPKLPRTTIGVRVSPSAVAELARIGMDKDWTMSHVARHLLERGLRDYLAEEAAASPSRARGR